MGSEAVERLFAVSPVSERLSGVGSSRVGAVAEMQAVVRLLELGHSVAVPVVDDDGVDLVVDYRLAVQVKSSVCRSRYVGCAPIWEFEFRCGKDNGRRAASVSERGREMRHVDFFLFFGRDEGVWWVVPRSALPAVVKRWRVRPGATSDLQWREAWHLLGVAL